MPRLTLRLRTVALLFALTLLPARGQGSDGALDTTFQNGGHWATGTGAQGAVAITTDASGRPVIGYSRASAAGNYDLHIAVRARVFHPARGGKQGQVGLAGGRLRPPAAPEEDRSRAIEAEPERLEGRCGAPASRRALRRPEIGGEGGEADVEAHSPVAVVSTSAAAIRRRGGPES